MLKSVSIQEHFMELVRDAIKNQNLQTQEITEFYIVNLLSEYTRIENFRGKEMDLNPEEPLAITFIKAFESGFKKRFSMLKRVGDFSLFLSGFFSESLKRKPVDIEYYMTIGENAYAHLATLSQTSKNHNLFHNIFNELSERFGPFVDVLIEVSEKSSFTPLNDIMRLYDMWLKTKKKRYEELLMKKGIKPLQNIPSRRLH